MTAVEEPLPSLGQVSALQLSHCSPSSVDTIRLTLNQSRVMGPCSGSPRLASPGPPSAGWLRGLISLEHGPLAFVPVGSEEPRGARSR